MQELIGFSRIQYIALTVSILFLFLIIELVRNGKIKESYSILWLLFAVSFILLSIWRNGLEIFSRFVGVFYPPAALFLILFILIILILIQFSIVISKQSKYIKDLTQEIALLRLEYTERIRAMSEK
jgi:hypothetical protein